MTRRSTISRLVGKLVSARRPHMEYVPEGWSGRDNDPPPRGWNVESVSQVQRREVDELLRVLSSSASWTEDPIAHHNFATFAYVAALAAHSSDSLSVLDWGGGVGHYGMIARAVLPEVKIKYHCKEVPLQCQAGREVFPEAVFYSSDDDFRHLKFDLVMAIGALQYVQDWQEVLGRLIESTERYLFITRLPVLAEGESFVWVHRPYEVAYNTEYLGWCLNRNQFLGTAESSGAVLIREFLVNENYRIHGAPSPCRARGFLFRVEAR